MSYFAKRFDRSVFTGLPLTIFVVVILVLLGTFVGITDSIVNSLPIVTIDVSFENSLYMVRSPSLAQTFYVITYFADQITIGILMVMALAYLYFKKELTYIYSLILTFVGAETSVYLIKILINRTRPPTNIAFYIEQSGSFPSGHAATALAFFGFVAYYLVRHIVAKDKKFFVVLIASIIIALVGFSRLYLGVHYLSDVIGGFIMGGLWLVAGITFREHHFYNTSLKKGKNPSM